MVIVTRSTMASTMVVVCLVYGHDQIQLCSVTDSCFAHINLFLEMELNRWVLNT
jgi:hypothetical protein